MTLRYKDLQPIPAEELRIGNHVQADGVQYEIKSVGEKLCKVKALHSTEDVVTIKNTADLRPITVNESRIEELGFKYIPHRLLYKKTGFLFSVNYDKEDTFLLVYGSHTVLAKGRFIHHLQNLITDLTLKPE